MQVDLPQAFKIQGLPGTIDDPVRRTCVVKSKSYQLNALKRQFNRVIHCSRFVSTETNAGNRQAMTLDE